MQRIYKIQLKRIKTLRKKSYSNDNLLEAGVCKQFQSQTPYTVIHLATRPEPVIPEQFSGILWTNLNCAEIIRLFILHITHI
jgi:hypothetical protein